MVNQTTSNAKNKKRQSAWGHLFTKLNKNLRDPAKTVTMPCVFFTAVLLFGGMGIWFPFFTYKGEVVSFNLTMANAIATYFLAILATVFAELSFGLFEKLVHIKETIEGGSKPSTEVSVWAFTFVIGSLLLIAGTISLVTKSEYLALVLAIPGMIISLILWWIVNADNTKYREGLLDVPYDSEIAVADAIDGQGVSNGPNAI